MKKYLYDISIVMAYYNRKQQLCKTLDGFEKQYVNKYNFEVVIIDDNSIDEHDLSEEIKKYSFPINLFKVNCEEKQNTINSCLAYNKGFSLAEGRIVMIQNPECYHVGDLLKYTIDNLKEDCYFSYSCYAANSFENTIQLTENKNPYKLIKNQNFDKNNANIIGLSWYNHPSKRPSGYHFCSAIHHDKLQLIGGFDRRFATGYCFDDCEFLLSIKHNLQLDIQIIEPKNGFVIHQFHTNTGCTESCIKDSNFTEKRLRNKRLYEEMKKYHEKKQFAFPKLLHLYWDGSPLSYLNLITILSFNNHHKFWKINVHTPVKKTEYISWRTHEQKTKYTGKCYFHELYNIPNVFIHQIDLDEIGFDNNASEVIKSDYFRYYILYKHGGVWSDFDIVYTSSIEDHMNFYKQNTVITRCTTFQNPKNKVNANSYKYFPIGFFLSQPNNKFFKYILDMCAKYYDSGCYQSIGAAMWDKLFRPNQKNAHIFDSNIHICNEEYYIPYAYNELNELFIKKNNTLPPNNIGIHWFNGSSISKEYTNDLDTRLDNFVPNCFLDQVIKQYINKISLISESNLYKEPSNSKYTIKYSIILPYYKRYDQFQQTLVSYKKHYKDRKDFEILIAEDYKNLIDDNEHRKLLSLVDENKDTINIKIISMNHSDVYNPCLAYNECSIQSEGEFLVLSNPECFHETNILKGFDKEFEANDLSYIVCSCLAIENLHISNKTLIYDIDSYFSNYHNGWLQHSEYNNRMLHFCSSISKSQFLSLKGFDENYKYGISWEDEDFVNTLKTNNILIKCRDDLKVLHLKHNRSYQNEDLIKINANYYRSKWLS